MATVRALRNVGPSRGERLVRPDALSFEVTVVLQWSGESVGEQGALHTVSQVVREKPP